MNSIFPVSVINHTVREQMELNAIEFMVGEYYLWRSMGEWVEEPAATTGDILGLSATQVGSAKRALVSRGFVKAKGNKLCVTPLWTYNIKLQQGGHKVASTAKSLAQFFLKTLDEEGKKAGYNLGVPSYKNKVSVKAAANKLNDILKQMDVTEDHIRLIVQCKVSEWGGTDQQQYLRTSTLLRSKNQFEKYLADSIQWGKKRRNEHNRTA